MDFLCFHAKAQQIFSSAKIRSMTGSEVETFLLIKACSDKELLEEFLKLETPTERELLACARAHEAIKSFWK